MKIEDTVLCLCSRQNIEAEHHQRLETIGSNAHIDWEYVFATAHQHLISPLVFRNLKQCGLPVSPQARELFEQVVAHNMAVKEETAVALQEVLGYFASEHIDVMLLKGSALDLTVFKHPWQLISYDVDLLIRQRKEDLPETVRSEIIDLLEALNHRQESLAELIEYDFYSHHDVTMNGIVPFDPERVWQDAHELKFAGHRVYVMSAEDMLLAAAVQCCRKRFFRLKTLISIPEIVRASPELDWEVVVQKARDYHANVILYTALLITEKLLGYKPPSEVLPDLKVNALRKPLITQLVNKLIERYTLSELFVRSHGTLLGRQFSRPLILTYATYRVDQLGPKMKEIYRFWRGAALPS